MSSRIRLGTASPASQATTAATLSQVSTIANRAAAAHIDILLLPEAYIGGYPRGSAFGSVVGERSAAGREEYAKYFEQAVDLGDTVGNGAGAGQQWVKRSIGPSNETRGDGTREELERIARDSGVFIVVGCIERAGGSLYCSVLYVCPEKGTIGKRRKVMPTGTERLIWAQGCPSTLKAVSTTIRGTRVNLVAAICWENYMPLLRQAIYSQNVNLYLAPTADGRDAWLSLMRSIGVEGRCFVVSSNMCVRDEESTSNGINATRALPNGSGSRLRRSSTITQDGHEIVLPRASPIGKKKKRRKSVIDADGNEIVLGCDEDGNCSPINEDPETISPQTFASESGRGTSAIGEEEDVAASIPRRVDPEKKRRKSVIDEHGNEIVLCCDEDDVTFGTPGGGTKHNGVSQSNGKPSFRSRGGSSIVGPFGDVLAGPQWEDEDGLIHADVDFRDCIKGRLDLDAAGSYSRNDSFRFSVQGLDLEPLPY